MRELLLLKMAVPHMTQIQKDGLKEKTLESINVESIKCHKRGMTLEQILAPSYKNKDFMFILNELGIDKDKLSEIVKQFISEYEHANRSN
jgi:hypothetical protein